MYTESILAWSVRMYPFLHTFLDMLFPPSPDERRVRDATIAAVMAEYSPYIYAETVVLASYRAPLVHALIHEAKFRHNIRAITLLGELVGTHLRSAIHTEINLVPLPLSPQRLKERGYNQTLEIARATQVHNPSIHIHHELLKKVRHTPLQTSLPRKDRLLNLKGAFAVGECTLSRNTPLILFDDVVTTSATLAEASRTLKNAGFIHVEQLALAH